MESMLTGDAFSGVEAARLGWANRAYPVEELEDAVLGIAGRIAQIPTDLAQINKRTVHRAMSVMGLRESIRAGTELSALGTRTSAMRTFIQEIDERGLRDALTDRDAPFGDYRTVEPHATDRSP
jgi:enoyl-CoA hydratase